MRRAVVMAVLATGLLASSCGEAELPAGIEAQVEITADNRSANAGVDFNEGLTPAEEDCLTESVGVQVLGGNVFEGSDTGDDARTAVAQSILDCVEDPSEWTGFVEGVAVGMEAAFADGVDLSTDESACFVREVVANADDPARVFAVGDSEDALTVLAAALYDCLTAENFSLATGAESDLRAYGDDPDLDDLHDRCSAGSMTSCDLLWWQSAVGTEYEEHARACGGLTQVDDWCSGVVTGLDRLVDDAADPGLAVLVADCQDGDLFACDLVFQFSIPGTDAEEIGRRCGPLEIPSRIGNCRRFDDE
ncbi:MAG: hypothetical protein P8J50_03625 [Acidimicrobiales bacterium]|nr:hypothetical protein [Acidimicrobiales bacterium]